MENNLFNDDLEFHYVVSCRGGKWYHSTDVESAVLEDGTVYDWENYEWIVPSGKLETIDFAIYSVLHSALSQLNGYEKTNGEN